MTVKLKFKVTLFLSAFLIFTFSENAKGQKLLDKLKKKKDDIVNQKIDDILNGKKKDTTSKPVTLNTTNDQVNSIIKNESNNSNERPKLSEISDADFIQNTSNPPKNESDTRFRIAKNLVIDMTGKYPVGYLPKWRFINYTSSLSVEKENWFRPTSKIAYTKYPLSIGQYDDKAVVRLTPVPGCECFADIVVKNDFTVLNSQPQTFQITNFRKILNERSTGEACMNAYNNNRDLSGGYEGKITLSANDDGDITMDFMMEYYSEEWKERGKYNKAIQDYDWIIHPKQVSYRYSAKNITIENEMTTTKANDIVAKEKEAKQRLKDYIAKTTKQSDSLQKIIANKYPQKECRDCFVRNSNSSLKVTPTKTAYRDGYGDVYVESGTDWDINTKTEIKNKCGYDLTFIGLQQMHDTEKGYYLIEVTKTMEKGYNYSSEQGAMATVFTSLIGGGSEFNIIVQDKYYPNYATVGAVQWLKVIKK